MRNLNNIFKTNNRQAQRRVLDKFDISREDKNKTLNKLADANGGGGSVSKYAPRYFKIDWDKAAYDWYKVLTHYESNGSNNYYQMFAASYKIYSENTYLILPITCVKIGIRSDMITAFCYIPNCAAVFVDDNLDYAKINSFEKTIQGLSSRFNLSMDGITEITEDEYYKID